MTKRSDCIGRIVFLILLTVALTVTADDPLKKLKWIVDSSQQDSSNPFDPIDPESILVTDPAYSAQDPVSELLTDASYGAQDPESIEIVNKIINQTYATSSKKKVITRTKSEVKIETNKEESISLDSAGNTVTKVFEVTEKITNKPVTTTTTKTTTRTTTYENGEVATKVTDINITKNTIDKETGRELIERKLISTKVTPNVKKTWFTSVSDKKTTTQDPTFSSSVPVERKVESTDKNGSTVIDIYHTYTDTITTPTVFTTTTITTEHTLWTDGKTTTSDITTSKDSPLSNVVTTKKREEHVDQKVIPHIVSTNDTQEEVMEIIKGKPVTVSDCTVQEKRHKDGSKNIIIRISEICKNTTETPVTTVKSKITKRNTLWTDKTITSKEIDRTVEESISYSKTTDTKERRLGSEIIEYQKLDEKESQDRLEDYLNSSNINPEGLSDSDRKRWAELICQKFKSQGVEFTLSARYYGSDHNWNEPSGFEKLYDLIEECLRQ